MINKVIFILAQGHTGSTLLDSILGVHESIVSSGELMYLNYQIERNSKRRATKENQDICTCLNPFIECGYWSKVLDKIYESTGSDVANDPMSFDRAFFGQFAYKERDGHTISEEMKFNKKKTLRLLLNDVAIHELLEVEPRIDNWVENEKVLFESMAEIANKSVVVDSSKDTVKALLFKKYFPELTQIIIVSRGILGHYSSIKRLAQKRGKGIYALPYTIKERIIYNNSIKRIKNIYSDGIIEIDYEQYVKYPKKFLNCIATILGLPKMENPMTDDSFYIDPSKLHLVAGNPMRYQGKKLVAYDNRHSTEVTTFEKGIISFVNLCFRL